MAGEANAQPLAPLPDPPDAPAMQGMTPSANRRAQMERERREQLAHELSERTRLKRAAAKHVMAFWNMALAAGWRTIFYPTVGTAWPPDATGSTSWAYRSAVASIDREYWYSGDRSRLDASVRGCSLLIR